VVKNCVFLWHRSVFKLNKGVIAVKTSIPVVCP